MKDKNKKGFDNMGKDEPKKGRKPKSKSRTRLEICNENANKLVTKAESFLKDAQKLKDKINGLGGGEFSSMATGFNNLIGEVKETIDPMPFETTEREEMASAPASTGKKFSDYQKMEKESEPESEKS